MPITPNTQSSLTTWLEHLLSIHPTEIEMGLTRVASVAQKMQLLNLGKTKIITVAGTNGKGTTCAFIEQILMEAEQRVGVYSSPHLLRYNERVRIAGIDASDADFIEAFCAIDKARGDISLTFFEYATLAALVIFKQADLDVVVLEVGLGGRLDATNIIDADISVVTSIDIDHQEYLGDTRELVGREKAGIFRQNRPAIAGDRALPQSVRDVADQVQANLFVIGEAFELEQNQENWNFKGHLREFVELPYPQLPLPNAVTALAVIEQLLPDITEQQVREGIRKAQLTGRLELVSESPTILLDVAHNPHAAHYLKLQLAKYGQRRIVALCGMLKDKDSRSVISILSDVVEQWFFTDLDSERSAKASQLLSCLPADKQGDAFESIASAYAALSEKICIDDVVIVFGSFYTVSEFKQLDLG